MRKKCRRKVYQLVNPIEYAIAGASVTQKEKLDKLALVELIAIESMVKGQGTVQDWRVLVDMMNVSEVMANNGIGPEVLPICEEVQKHMVEAKERYEKTKKMGLSGPGIKAVKELFAYAELQRSSIPLSRFEQMIDKTANYIRSNGHRVVHLT